MKLEEIAARELKEAFQRFVAWREQAEETTANPAQVFTESAIALIAALIVRLERTHNRRDSELLKRAVYQLRSTTKKLHKQISGEQDDDRFDEHGNLR